MEQLEVHEDAGLRREGRGRHRDADEERAARRGTNRETDPVAEDERDEESADRNERGFAFYGPEVRGAHLHTDVHHQEEHAQLREDQQLVHRAQDAEEGRTEHDARDEFAHHRRVPDSLEQLADHPGEGEDEE